MTVSTESNVKIAQYPEISLCSAQPDGFFLPDSSKATLSLFGTIPVKSVELIKAEPPTLILGGEPFGIKLLMEGVMVTGLGGIEAENGTQFCPAEESGIKAGDIVHSADGQPLSSNAQLQSIINRSGGKTIELIVERDGRTFTASLKPVFSAKSRQWRGGMWVRDSIAGIGTLTFIDSSTGRFAGLGHPICDSDTGGVVSVQSGEAVPVEITNAKRGERGIPGELCGRFTDGESLGTLESNSECGVFGTLSEKTLGHFIEKGETYPLGYRQDITTGKAEVYTTVSGDIPQKYGIEIERIDYTSSDSTKNMLIRITDERLLEASGGIIQGMSGSPIIQNGRIIGAVTHVFVTDPTCGFAVFAENMAETLNGQN